MKKVAFIFPGQGSQKVGMGKDFFDNSNVAEEMMENASERLGLDFSELLFEENDKLSLTEYTQPAILLVSSIAYKLFADEVDIVPSFSLGHSLGEFSALVSVNALKYLDGVELVNQRGKFMQEACEGLDVGMMALIGLDDETVENITSKARDEGKKVWAANYNSDGQIVAAGLKSDLAELEMVFKEAGAKRAILLPMSVASHCPLLDSAVVPLQEKMTPLIGDSFIAPVVSNVTAEFYDTKDKALSLLAKQLTKPVLYRQSIQKHDNDVDFFIEFGGNVLKGLNKRNTKKATYSITDMKSLEEAIELFN